MISLLIICIWCTPRHLHINIFWPHTTHPYKWSVFNVCIIQRKFARGFAITLNFFLHMRASIRPTSNEKHRTTRRLIEVRRAIEVKRIISCDERLWSRNYWRDTLIACCHKPKPSSISSVYMNRPQNCLGQICIYNSDYFQVRFVFL